MFIVIEGVDGAGKTTQVNILKGKVVGGKSVRTTKEPTDGKIGKLIRELLSGKNLDNLKMQLLFAADREEHLNSLIKDSIDSNEILVSDRYIFSSLSYGIASGLDAQWLIGVNSQFPVPDMTIIIDLEPDVSLSRISARDSKEAFENIKFLTEVRKAYKFLAGKYSNCFIIDGSKSIDEVQQTIIELINTNLK
ncbi:thymidylate kinase [Candidatus Mancarchaeum acidiphilum]|uniref:Probable thymidylate kinase n=1 Tax=Candidatus Mancarchaeum acidiphilum TaxID=1920749 RepID=A0A218NMI2_9ARCH|nr:dTMP kinase [Candidatus Mancarchaeum acidiphilum]ASI13661.1 thymidylate kinase [Candidatus Mancarchaeum acidiphilum]